MNSDHWWITGLNHLFFPRTCRTCENILFHQEHILCTKCLYNLPKTNFWKHKDNPVAEMFWGRTNLYSAASFLFFNKGSRVQKMMHNLKYKGKQDVGIFLGELIGSELKKSDLYNNANVIIPVPIHPKKKLKRGYNQSDLIAKGMAKSMGIETQTNNLIKTVNTESQTKKSRHERWLNVNNVFRVRQPEILEGKHIILVDDVITTGATIEACANVLNEIPGVKVSVISLAYAQG